jgi:DEAD/DEAH box helicase domain-containing protein
MLPSVIAGQLQKGISDYIETTFQMTNPTFKGSIRRMLETKNAFFHEPYFAVSLPFRVADDSTVPFDAIHQQYKPYIHQQIAFRRLCGDDGRSTLIATGTGSGKTECFLYPILEYCYQHRNQPGIKALLIYPMNALANDQAKRIAQLIHNSPELRGNVTAGMYVGGREERPTKVMTEDQIITDHDTILSSPPSILLTNYKMLDYLLIRPKDAALWDSNKPDSLKYIVVDELHTFDGAQGTDLACLLRRLKTRLYIQSGYICCIGTSATMGEKDRAGHIRTYASEVFGEIFEDDAVITEDRLTSDEFFRDYDICDTSFPSSQQIDNLKNILVKGDLSAYLKAAGESWLDPSFTYDNIQSDETRLALGRHLMGHAFTRSMLEALSGNYLTSSTVVEKLLSKYPQLNELNDPNTAIDALLALISHARIGTPGNLRPFLTVHVQLWIRELRRFLAKVSPEKIEYALAADLNEEQTKHFLPVVHCRECGETGWVSIINERKAVPLNDLQTFYNLYFRCDSKVVMMFPHEHHNPPEGMDPGWICPECMQLVDTPDADSHCPSCTTDMIPIIFPRSPETWGKARKQYICPFCESKRGLSIIGLRNATIISANITQMFASKFNDDKKILAFNDNVQDASYHAGFFNARTWRFNLRGAIQRYALIRGNGQSLPAFCDGFIDFWQAELTKEEFIGRFIPPNLTWRRAYENMVINNKLVDNKDSEKLLSDIKHRLKYEIMLEYGRGSRMGRTLEKTGLSSITPDQDKIQTVVKKVQERVINEQGTLRETDKNVFEHLVLGFVNILRTNGAFNDSVFSAFTNNRGRSYLLSNDYIHWLPGLQSGRNTPRFIYEPLQDCRRISAFDTLLKSRYTQWIKNCLLETIIEKEILDGIAKIILDELIKAEIIVTMPTPTNYKVYALNKSKFTITTDVKMFFCRKCGTHLTAANQYADIWKHAPCIRQNCTGKFISDENPPLGYYSNLYTNGDFVRTVAKEHTGLLTREDREDIEKLFKKKAHERNSWDVNVLSSTPTLEMGIDIGDLSSVILCNVPPAEAQFLQRTGRAGRKDGNSLTLVIAKTTPHDLYYYTEPMEMIDGILEPPNVFLRASAVLERQFVAYCLDCWVKKGVSQTAIPKHIGVCITNLEKHQENQFPFNFQIYVKNNISSLFRSFVQMFVPSLDEDTIKELKTFALGFETKESPMYLKIHESLLGLKEHRTAIIKNIQHFNALITDLESKPRDPSYDKEIADLKMEKSAFVRVVQNISNKDVFNFFSDEGLLPNYAFPESGIILKAVLYRKEEGDQEDKEWKQEKMVYEYTRSAASAISEFAPLNTFYVDGRKLKINRVDLTTAQIEKWRLCPNCSHAQLEKQGIDVAACPQCGSPDWADAGQVRNMLKAKLVYSFENYKKVLVNDEDEDRAATFYCKQLLVDVDENKDIISAYRMDNTDFAFGYEFVKKATMREINFGEADTKGDRLRVAGIEDVKNGFKICRYCGKIQEGDEIKHSATCKAKDLPPGSEDPVEKCLFLYREFSTEALRILVPATTLDSTKVRMESFTAAFMLGMQEYFGNVDHLRACISEVPIPDAEYRKQYLVIFDSVPGGTGYLKQLMLGSGTISAIFEKALSALENCACKEDPQKDGCYHCLYAFKQNQNTGQISRKTAIELLKTILSGKESLVKIDKLGNIPVNSLFESELERRFIEAFGKIKKKTDAITITNDFVNGKKGYHLTVGNCEWDIEPQVILGEKDGVSVQSRPDFLLRPKKSTPTQKSVAIFADGFLYHKDKIADDTLKREAIVRSGKYRVWSMSWRDVETVFQKQTDYATPTLSPEDMPSSTIYHQIIKSSDADSLQPSKLSAMELLIEYLSREDAETIFTIHARAYAMSLLDVHNRGDSVRFNEWKGFIDTVNNLFPIEEKEYTLDNTLFGKWEPCHSPSLHTSIYSGVEISDLGNNKMNASICVCACLNDIKEIRSDKYEQEWNGFLHFFNMMQFLENFLAISSTGLSLGAYEPLKYY